MLKSSFIATLTIVLGLAAASIWLGQIWRLEAGEYQAEKERVGGIQKQRLMSEGEKRKGELIAEEEADAIQIRALIEGRASGNGKIIEAAGESERIKKLNVATASQGYALQALSGIDNASSEFFRKAADGGPDAKVFEKIARYLRRAAIVNGKLRTAGSAMDATRGNCVAIQQASTTIALELVGSLKNSRN